MKNSLSLDTLRIHPQRFFASRFLCLISNGKNGVNINSYQFLKIKKKVFLELKKNFFVKEKKISFIKEFFMRHKLFMCIYIHYSYLHFVYF